MSTKMKRKVTVENKESSDQPRRPSVFERLGPGAVNVTSQSQDRSSRIDRNEKCHNWLRGTCNYGINCRYQHGGSFPNTSRRSKNEKDIVEKDLRYKMKNKRDETRESKTGSVSPKRKEKKRSRSRSRKGEHENKIKSTVVVTRPKSPATQSEPSEKEKKKNDGSWEDDSDDWPMDASQLDYKEELTLERKRQQLQRELALELQKEQMLRENRSVSESSSSSSSSDSGSITSTSDSTSSSSDEDSDDSSSSSSSTSSRSSASQIPQKKSKKPQIKKESAHDHKKPIDDYDKIKSSRALKSTWRPRSSVSPDASIKKVRERKNASPNFSPKRRSGHDNSSKVLSSQAGGKGPRTPSPAPVGSKQRQWGQSSSADSRSADTRRSRSKRHKKKKDGSKGNKNKMEYAPTPPPLSSPNRTVLQPNFGKKSRNRDDLGLRNRHKDQEQSPLLLSRVASQSNSPSRHSSNYSEVERYSDKQNITKSYNRKLEDGSRTKTHSKERPTKYSRTSSPLSKDLRRLSISPLRDKYDNDSLSKGMYSPPLSRVDKEDKRKRSLSPPHRSKDGKERRKVPIDLEKRRENRDFSPRSHDNRRDNQYRSNDLYRKEEVKETKKNRDEKGKDRLLKERNLEHDNWPDESKKNIRNSDTRRLNEPILTQSGRDRPRNRERDRKKGKERELSLRATDEIERQRLSPTLGRVPSDLHHGIRDDVSRGRMYDPEIPPDGRDYGYGYAPHRDSVYLEEPALPPEYESDLRVPPLYPPPDPVDYPSSTYSESRYRRDTTLKAVAPVPHIERIGSYARDLSPLGPRDAVGLPVHDEDYLTDLPIDERRSYDERWRSRPIRDDWDSYVPLPSSPLPPHVAAGLNEDRYGLPRRRRASPDWMPRRNEEREIPLREPRSRSPPHRREDLTTGRGWNDHTDRHGNVRSDVRQETQQKPIISQDDRKNKNNRRDRRDRNKRTEDPISDTKLVLPSKDKTNIKRPHSPSPNRKGFKKRKDDVALSEAPPIEKTSATKKIKDEVKSEIKSANQSKRGKATDDDNFSDWSDGDDDLLNRDDFVESESNTGNKGDENKKEKSSKPIDSKDIDRKPKRDSSKDSRIRTNELKSDSRSRTASKERHDTRDFERLLNYSRKSIDVGDRIRVQNNNNKRGLAEVPTPKSSSKPCQITKENTPTEVTAVKKEEMSNADYMANENNEYDPISDEELEALIEEPDDSIMKTEKDEDMKIVNVLEINWATLMTDSKPERQPSKARNRFKAAHVLSRIGFSQSLAGSALTEKIINFCQKQLQEEKEKEENQGISSTNSNEQTFTMEHPIASFHVALMRKKKERQELFSSLGSCRQALSARQDLYIRKSLCHPPANLLTQSTTSVAQQNTIEAEQPVKLHEVKEIKTPSPILNAVC